MPLRRSPDSVSVKSSLLWCKEWRAFFVDICYEMKYHIGIKVKRKVMQVAINYKILQIAKENHDTITTSQVTELGFSRALLSYYVKLGILERERQGVYILTDSIHDDMYTLMLRSKKIIFSHDTALFLNGLSERTPFTHSVTIPSNAKLSSVLQGNVRAIISNRSYIWLVSLLEKIHWEMKSDVIMQSGQSVMYYVPETGWTRKRLSVL